MTKVSQAPHIDKTDFLNAVVREKKRFENVLDDSVAAGMNAGTDVLMNQVEHIIVTRTKLREYYPAEDAPMDLRATEFDPNESGEEDEDETPAEKRLRLAKLYLETVKDDLGAQLIS